MPSSSLTSLLSSGACCMCASICKLCAWKVNTLKNMRACICVCLLGKKRRCLHRLSSAQRERERERERDSFSGRNGFNLLHASKRERVCLSLRVRACVCVDFPRTFHFRAITTENNQKAHTQTDNTQRRQKTIKPTTKHERDRAEKAKFSGRVHKPKQRSIRD